MTPAVNFLDEVAEHPLCGVEVGDYAVLEWTNRDDIARGPTDHFFGFSANRQDPAGVVVDCHD